MKTVLPNADVYTDLQGLARLKAEARDPKQSMDTLKAVAQQFEALFTQMMLKSMRAASPGEDLFGSEQADFYRDMHDQQLAVQLSKGRGMGLAEMLVKQLGGAIAAKAASAAAGSEAQSLRGGASRAFGNAEDFVRELWPQAQRAGRELGVKPELLLAQAANETGWGRNVITHPDGRPSFNLFGIKANAAWSGARVTVPTVEYADGVMVRQHDAFRAYDSYADSFRDYVGFLRDNPRYQDALASAADPRAFAGALQEAGYATDPAYGRKLMSIFNGPTLRDALAALKSAPDAPITS